MILRDLYCTVCNHVARDVMVDSATVRVDMPCPACSKKERTEVRTIHKAVCNGGTGHYRWRECDLPEDPRWYRGQVEVLPPEATQEGKPVESLRGGAMHDRVRATHDERWDKRYWEQDHDRGSTPLHFDMRKA